MSRKVLAVVGGVMLILAAAGGAFYGGMLYERQQAANVRAAFFADRGGGTGGNDGAGGGGNSGGNFFGGGSAPGGRGAFGQIKSIDGDTLTLSTPQREIKVRITEATQFQKVVAGERGDLAVGDNITVRGQADANGNVTADSIQVGGTVSIPAVP